MKYYLHYVASGKSGIYGKDVFIKEAKKIGVNRSLPHFIMKKLKWGNKILLANFESRHTGEKNYSKCPDCKGNIFPDKCTEGNPMECCASCKGTGKIGKLQKFQDGIAHVFGYFVIEGLNLIASDELKQRLYSQLDIVSSNNNSISVKRSCGSYVVSSSHTVTNSLADIIEKVQVLAKEINEKVKYFIAGKFYELNSECSKCKLNPIFYTDGGDSFGTRLPKRLCPTKGKYRIDKNCSVCKGTGKQAIKIEGVNFSRSLVEVDFEQIKNIQDIQKEVGFIQDYNKKTYIPKKERA